MENVKEELTIVNEIKKQQEHLGTTLAICEKILQVLRGTMPQEDTECIKDECLFDTLKIDSQLIREIEKDVNEIAKKIIG